MVQLIWKWEKKESRTSSLTKTPSRPTLHWILTKRWTWMARLTGVISSVETLGATRASLPCQRPSKIATLTSWTSSTIRHPLPPRQSNSSSLLISELVSRIRIQRMKHLKVLKTSILAQGLQPSRYYRNKNCKKLSNLVKGRLWQ